MNEHPYSIEQSILSHDQARYNKNVKILNKLLLKINRVKVDIKGYVRSGKKSTVEGLYFKNGNKEN